MSDTNETLDAEPADFDAGDPQQESEVELVDESLIDEIDVSDDESNAEVSDEIDLDGQKLSKKDLKDLLAKRDNLQRDYTQKTMALAEERKQTEQLRAQREQALGQVHQVLSKTSQEIDEFNSIDWDAVAEQRPDDWEKIYTRAQIAHVRNLQQMQQAEQAQQAIIEQRTHEEVQESLRSIPELQSSETRNQFLQKAQAFIQQFGLDESFVSNHKVVKMLAKSISDADKAAKYDEIVAKAKSKSRQNAQSDAPEPPARTRSASPSRSGLSDDLPIDEWVKRRQAQLNRR